MASNKEVVAREMKFRTKGIGRTRQIYPIKGNARFLVPTNVKSGVKYGSQIKKIVEKLEPLVIEHKLAEQEVLKRYAPLEHRIPGIVNKHLKRLGRQYAPELIGAEDFEGIPEKFGGRKLPSYVRIGAPQGKMHLIVEDGIVKGGVTIKPRTGATEIKTIYILPEYRKQGIATKVVQSILRNPKVERIAGLSILPAKKFWEDVGGIETGSIAEQEALKEHIKTIQEKSEENELIRQKWGRGMLPSEDDIRRSIDEIPFTIEKEEFLKRFPVKAKVPKANQEQDVSEAMRYIGFARPLRLKSMIKAKTNFPGADFWIQRKGSQRNVGTVSKTFSPSKIGVKVTKTKQLVPDFLYYAMQYVKDRGYFAQRARGTLNLKHIRIKDVTDIPVQRGKWRRPKKQIENAINEFARLMKEKGYANFYIESVKKYIKSFPPNMQPEIINDETRRRKLIK